MSDDPWDGSFTETEAYFSLCESGFEALAEGRLDRSEEVATELEGRRASVGFELRAHARLHAGDPAGAITALEAGTAAAPGNWVLWQLMGNCCSDVEDFERADAAYERAAGIDEADVDSIALNRAVMASRSGGPSAGLAALDAYEPVHLAQRHAALASEYLRELGRTQEALARAKVALDQAREDQDDARALLLVQCSHALREMNRRREARAAAETAHSIERGHPEALHALRLLDPEERDPEHVPLRVLVRGVWPFREGTPAQGFFTTYHAVAHDAEDALERARLLEPAEIRDTLVVEEFEVIDGDADAPPGIYGMSGLSFFPSDEQG